MSIATDRIAAALTGAGLLVEIRGTLPPKIESVQDDSRRVGKGDLFIAVRGAERDGHDFLDAARAAGAVVAVVEDASRTSLPALVVKEGRRAAAHVAAAAYEYPARRMKLLGVTGTNGKTTTVHILRHLLDTPAVPAASIGTIGVMIGSAGRELPDTSGLTTPGPVELRRVLRALVASGVGTLAMEVSSHALDQYRVDVLTFAAIVFTNLTRDHLDYHATMEAYRAAKERLVQYLAPGGTVVLNADDPAWRSVGANHPRLSFSASDTRADVHAADVAYTAQGSRWTLSVRGERRAVQLPLLGDFNVANALGAAAAASAMGMSTHAIAARLSSVPQVPGRLEVVHERPTVLRDYAHTPDALGRALRAVRPFTRGKLVVVFGAGGDRDKGKRPEMGALAEQLADHAIVTSDNPRTEDPDRILDDIEAGMRRKDHDRIEDRRTAIARALERAGPDDVVLLAGKGHETYQVRGTTKHPFDERTIVAELTRAAGGAA